ncbi:AAA family ATPase [Candidatus Halobeggiatoa sp. HSG11]|nr:AAA family ATPase [Candidatus Halobeggiatoa sp. HSG11]
MLILPNYLITEQIYESANSIVYRGVRNEDNQQVILKMLKQDYPSSAELTRYQQEYEITNSLNSNGVIKTYGIEKYQNTLVIILEDFGGESLKQLMTDRPLTVKEFLPYTIQLANILANIHAANIIHKDINPSNIVCEPVTKQLKIIDFGISSRLPRENPTLKNPEQLEGTLPYISPEQTGRINRSIDYRTDLYSLGITFYEMLTGKLPFTTTDAIELVHCHIAKTPIPIHKISSEIPQIISDIVMKLLAKNAEDRYQSAFGVKADLEKVQENMAGLQDLPGLQFELAQNDFSGRFQIPQKLYGRENEVNILLKAFNRVSQGPAEMMLIAGYSGVGKTALVHEVHKPMTEKRGYFIAGKFEQYQRNIPYSALMQAFNEFCKYILTESIEQLQQWKTKILTAIGDNGQVLVDIFPNLEQIIGPQAAVAKVGANEAQNRFNLVFQNFICAISQNDHPLILFIDDLQWADSATLNLLKTLMTGTCYKHFLIIGAYRDNEVDAAHPFIIMVDSCIKANTIIKTIKLQNLSQHDVNILIADALSCTPTHAQVLTDLVYEKTQGNAFFTHEFLKSLYEEELLTFDVKQYCWQWNAEIIAAKGITDNVVELMAAKIQKLPDTTKTLLKLAACIGNKFNLETLSIIYQQPFKETLQPLFEAVKEGLLLPIGNYNLLEVQPDMQFKFPHDRIQQAAYSLIPESGKPNFHLQIGRHLWQAADNLDANIFAIVDHLNLGKISQQTDIAQLNLQAAQKAKATAAYQPAYDYAQKGISLLEDNAWQTEYDLTLQLYNFAAETAYLNGDFEQMEVFAEIIIQQTNTVLDKVKIYEIKIQACVSQVNQSGAIDNALIILKLLGIELPKNAKIWHVFLELAKTKWLLRGKKIANLVDLPKMQQADKLAAMSIFDSVASAAYQLIPNLFLLTVFKRVELSVQYGNSPESPFGYGNYGIALCGAIGDIEQGYQFGRLSLELLSRFEVKEAEAKTQMVFNTFIRHWKQHCTETIPALLEDSYHCGMENGELEYASYSAFIRIYHLFFTGNELPELKQTIITYSQAVDQANQYMCLNYLNLLHQVVLNLTTTVEKRHILSGTVYQEEAMLANQIANDKMALYYAQLYKLFLAYLFGHHDEALAIATFAVKHIDAAIAQFIVPPFYFYDSLNCLALYPNASKQTTLRLRIYLNQRKLKKWAKHAPMNCLHKYYLVQAESCRVLKQTKQAMQFYEKAIAGAKKNGYIQEEALAYELAAKFYVQLNLDKISHTYMQESLYAYQKWGATAKVQDLEAKYNLKSVVKSLDFTDHTISNLINSSISTRLQTSTQLDLDSVTKASQTLAGEIVLSTLLEKIMRIVIENAGAERGLLILEKDNSEWVIEAEGILDADKITILQSIPVDGHLPISIVNYVVRTREPVVLADAMQEGIYTEDSYIHQHQLKSILCSPILHQGQLIGLLYLENNVMEGAFTKARLKIVDMLSSQAAISLENALLYRTLEQKVEQRTDQLAQANQEITTLNKQLKEENVRMGAELNVAKQLQQMVLPKEAELQQIDNLDIAGFMEPADEVGGDYYEILNHDGNIKIGIGDVTGHGLESGVIMLMVQTTVRALLLAGIDNPEQFLNIVNRTVYHNAQRMKTDKNLTLSLLDYQAGKLTVTGQHEEILLVKKDGKIEQIDTFHLGFMVGVVDDITSFSSHQELILQSGDGIVLYTDGITEAQNIEHEQYGLERLCEAVSANWLGSSLEVQQTVIADVKAYIGEQKVIDDITLLVLKQI